METVAILKVLYEVTIKLQKANCTLSDFYGYWIWAQLKLEKLQVELKKTDLHKEILVALKQKKSDLLENKALLCAVYLDPRYRRNLTANETALVKFVMGDMWEKVQELNITNQRATGSNEESSTSDPEDCLEKYFAEQEQDDVAINQAIVSRLDFLILLEKYEEHKRLHHSESVLNFWEEQKSNMPQIYQVASVFHSIPPSQATVERSFSALAFIFTPRRTQLGLVLLENILTIKLNKDIVQSIHEEEMKSI